MDWASVREFSRAGGFVEVYGDTLCTKSAQPLTLFVRRGSVRTSQNRTKMKYKYYLLSIFCSCVLGLIVYLIIIPDPCYYHCHTTPGIWIMLFFSDGDTEPQPFHPFQNWKYFSCFITAGFLMAPIIRKLGRRINQSKVSR